MCIDEHRLLQLGLGEQKYANSKFTRHDLLDDPDHPSDLEELEDQVNGRSIP